MVVWELLWWRQWSLQCACLVVSQKVPAHSTKTIESVVQPMQRLVVDKLAATSNTAAANDERKRLAAKINEGKESCRGCNKVIKGASMDWHGFWHVECLMCSRCRSTLVDRSFAEGDDGQPVCAECRLGSAKCVACLKQLEAGAFVTAGKHTYHPACFNCSLCHTNLRGQPYADVNGRPRCGKCASKP